MLANRKEWQFIPDPVDCAGKHVNVKYEGKAHPGNSGEHDLLVECMHKLSKKNTNCVLGLTKCFSQVRIVKTQNGRLYCYLSFSDGIYTFIHFTRLINKLLYFFH